MLNAKSLLLLQAAVPAAAFVAPGLNLNPTARGLPDHLPSIKKFEQSHAYPSSRVGRQTVITMAQKHDDCMENFLKGICKLNPFDQTTGNEEVDITFDDVAGVEEAKQELLEVVQFLKDPAKFEAVGAKIPKGIMLSGPPGTGKTLLAKAVAGEAGVKFFPVSGSQFVEMYVGVGASRVRDIFKQAKAAAPSIIFIDEIDAVAKTRSNGGPGGHEEREQTLNELLVQMDGFGTNSKVIVMAATNRVDTLDAALLRPGRFDRHVTVGLPDRHDREAILAVHAKGKPIDESLDLKEVAARTAGFSGADLANLLNEAAILVAGREDNPVITNEDINHAIDRVLAGPVKLKSYISEDRKKLVAYHEAGHALVGALLDEFDSVHKVSIVPRGNTGGLTWFIPDEEMLDSGLYTSNYLKNQIAVALGGRVAEELVFGKGGVTTGASSDLMRVTQVARNMVKIYGMSSLPPMNRNTHADSPMTKSYSESSEKKIDAEIDKIVMGGYNKAKTILTTNRPMLDELASTLMVNETVDGTELNSIVERHDPSMHLKVDQFVDDLMDKIKLMFAPPGAINFNEIPGSGNSTHINLN